MVLLVGDRPSTRKEPVMLEIRLIRRDGDTQCRLILDTSIIAEYAEAMNAGARFPPIRIWFDGTVYWLSDGFHRVAAAEDVGTEKISAYIHKGSLEDARWDSYAANSTHGMRRTGADIEAILNRMVKHPNGSHLSNRHLARHLKIPEATVRRWRQRVSASRDADTTRIAVRGSQTYKIQTANIKKSGESRRHKRKSLDDLRPEFDDLKKQASPEVRVLLVILGNWLFDGAPLTHCLERIEEVVKDLARSNKEP
jgi:hypothetical protein